MHTEIKTISGIEITVLNTGATITPEAQAMLGALHSRSIGGIKSHLEILAKSGADKFMSTYYVGYGHKSIGDLGSISVFIEGVSLLAAKAIQDFRLYNGQEASTRYIDFSVQPFINPLGTTEGEAVLEAWRAFYLKGLAALEPVLKERFPRGADEKEAIYDKAIKARAFDTMRGFLPAGATTNLVWHGPVRQFADRLLILRHHPLAEVREIAEGIEDAVLIACPNSFSKKRYEATEDYNRAMTTRYAYFDDDAPLSCAVARDNVDRDALSHYRDALSERPPKTELPKALAECGTVQFRFLLDFGSFRDIQRHRAVIQPMPLLTTKHGFEEWYLGELPEGLRAEAKDFLKEQEKAIAAFHLSPEEAQYYTGIGYRVANRVTGDLPALVYLVELRATRFVHPTLRARAIEMARLLTEHFGKDGLTLHLDADPDRFDVKRGEQDIVKKS